MFAMLTKSVYCIGQGRWTDQKGALGKGLHIYCLKIDGLEGNMIWFFLSNKVFAIQYLIKVHIMYIF